MLASSLDVSVHDAVTLSLHVTNASDSSVELRFPSGQIYDFAVLDSAGHEVWRWSADRMFTQALQTKSLDASQTMTLEERWDAGGRTGRFTAVARLASSNFPLEQHVEFTLP